MQLNSEANCYPVKKVHTRYNELMGITKKFGENLRVLREARELSQSELGRAVGVTKKHIYDLEKGKRKPSNKLTGKLTEHFGVTYAELTGEEPPSPVVLPMAKIAGRIACVPDKVYEYAERLGPKHELWEDIIYMMREAAERQEKASQASRS